MRCAATTKVSKSGKNHYKCSYGLRRSLLEVLDDDNTVVGDMGSTVEAFDEDI